MLDTYFRAEESEKVSAFDDLTLVELIVKRGEAAVDALPGGLRKNREAMAETIENKVRRLIIDEMAVNPKYYAKLSELLDALIEQRRQEALDYQAYLTRIVELTRLGWIRSKQRKVAGQDRQSQREMSSGESHYFQGRRYPDVKGCGRTHGVRLVGRGTMELRVPSNCDRDQRDAALQRWYSRQLRALLLHCSTSGNHG